MNDMGVINTGYEAHPYHDLTRAIQDWFEGQQIVNNPCGFACQINSNSIVASVLLPCMYKVCKEVKGNLGMIFIDGTSGLMSTPKINIIWIHIVTQGRSQIVGQILTSGKTTVEYETGLQQWKGLLTGNQVQCPFTDQAEGTFVGYNFVPLKQLEVDSTMSDKELALLNATKSILSPNHQILCRYYSISFLILAIS